MAINFHYLSKKESASMFTLDKRTYITYDGKQIAGDDHKGGKLFLGGAGFQIPLAQAIALGLAKSEKKEESKKPEPKKASKKAEPKKEESK